MLESSAITLNQRRKNCSLDDLRGKKYALVGDGDYAFDLLEVMRAHQATMPDKILVKNYQKRLSEFNQVLDDGTSPIEDDIILLGTGTFQLEMMERLVPRCPRTTCFYDFLLHKPATSQQSHAKRYLIYIDLYSQINIPRYLSNFFRALSENGYRVDVYHPLQKLDDEYIGGSGGTIMWNGSMPVFLPIKEKLRHLGLPVTYMECGFFPQSEYFYLDKQGVNAQSQLMNDDLSWVSRKDIQALEKLREEYFNGYLDIRKKDFVFVPLQVPSDSNVVNHSGYRDMQSFINYIEDLYADEQVIFKPHPKDNMADSYSFRHGQVTKDDIKKLISQARLVHGINSSVLYEAALYGTEVIAEGNCLLNRHKAQIQHLLAAMAARQMSVNANKLDFGVINKFSYLNINAVDRKEVSCD